MSNQSNETAQTTAPEWWISDGDVNHGGKKILGPFVSRELALEVRVLFEAHPRAKGLTYWVGEARTPPGEVQ